MTQTIKKFTDPFPHILVEEYYSPEELKYIWQELEFLFHPHKTLSPKELVTAPGNSVEGKEFLSTAKGFLLDQVYTDRNYSNILTINRKLFSGGYLNLYSELHPLCEVAKNLNLDFTKIRYYDNSDGYEPHVDIFVVSALTWLHKEPKKYSGGKLIFTEHGNSFNCDNNSLLIFPSCIRHHVTPVKLNPGENESSLPGRFCINQFLTFGPTVT